MQPCPTHISSKQICLTILMEQLLGSGSVCLASTSPLNYCIFSLKEVFTHLNSVEHLGFDLCFFNEISVCSST